MQLNLLELTLILTIVFQSLTHVQLFATPWTAAHQVSLSFTISRSLLKLMSIESVMPSNHLILCGPLLLLPSIFPSIRVFSNELALHINHRKLTKMIKCITALCNLIKLRAMSCRAPQMDGSWWRVMTKSSTLEKGMSNSSVFLPWEPTNSMKRMKWKFAYLGSPLIHFIFSYAKFHLIQDED